MVVCFEGVVIRGWALIWDNTVIISVYLQEVQLVFDHDTQNLKSCRDY